VKRNLLKNSKLLVTQRCKEVFENLETFAEDFGLHDLSAFLFRGLNNVSVSFRESGKAGYLV
jgi:hypothetical protein